MDVEKPNFYAAFGFKANPFEGNTAEREPEIERYAVRPPYLDPVDAASRVSGSYTLSGTRGSGKSATRITVQRNIWSDDKPHRLPIALTNFTAFRGNRSVSEAIELYAKQIFFLTIEASLVYLTVEDKKDISVRDSTQKKFLDWSIKTFYLDRSEDARTASARECCDTFSLSFARRSLLWADKRWDAITSSVIEIGSTIAKRFDFDVGSTESLKQAVAAEKSSQLSEPTFVLKKAVEFAQMMGFTGLLVQIDKVDETDWTNTDTEAAAKLVWPLYSNVQLHEIEGLSWSFFLWDRVRALLVNENGMPVRWDKLPNDVIKWDRTLLIQLVQRRLEFFSDDSVKRLGDLLDLATITEDDAYDAILAVSGMAPRTLISVLNSVLTNHIQRVEGVKTLLTKESLDAGLDNFASSTILDDYTSNTIEQLKKVERLKFGTAEVRKTFSISQQAASQKIEKWIASGLVRRDGQVYSQAGRKPVDQFQISDLKARRVVERQLDIFGSI